MKETNTKNIVLYSVIVALGAAVGYLVYQNMQAKKQTETATNNLHTSEGTLQTVQDDYNAALMRLDALKTENVGLDSLVNDKNKDLANLKAKIESILKNKNASDKDLAEAKTLITNLTTKIAGYEEQIKRLKDANAVLNESNARLATEKEKATQENTQLQEEKSKLTEQQTAIQNQKNAIETEKKAVEQKNSELSKKVELAKVLSATNIKISPMKKRFLTGKEANTDKAKRADNMKISFDLADNKISESGEKNLFIVVYDPEGNAFGSEKFKLENGTEKIFTISKKIQFVQGQATKNIETEWKPNNSKFTKGIYIIEIYQLGQKIGEEKVSLN